MATPDPSSLGTNESPRRDRSRLLPHPALGALLVCLAAGCARQTGPAGGPPAEEELRQEIASLRRLVHRAETMGLVPADGLVVAVSERLTRELVELTLPRERVVEGGFRVRLEKADVRYRDGYGAVRLEGRVSAVDDASASVDLTVHARTGTVVVDVGGGTLTVEVVPTGFEIHRVAVGEEDSRTRAWAEGLTQGVAGALTGLAAPLTIPVALERELRLGKLEVGPIRAPAASVPLKMTVGDVSAHGERLWIVLRVEAGRWTRQPR